jgi:hypothetical protein
LNETGQCWERRGEILSRGLNSGQAPSLAYADRFDYRPVYNGRPEKSIGWMGDYMGNCRLYLDRRGVMNFERFGHDIQMFGGRLEM